MDLAVIFGPLLVSPKDLSLEYCYKMPRVIRLVQTIIEKAGELFRTADNDSNPLPKSLDEFFGADQFGQVILLFPFMPLPVSSLFGSYVDHF